MGFLVVFFLRRQGTGETQGIHAFVFASRQHAVVTIGACTAVALRRLHRPPRSDDSDRIFKERLYKNGTIAINAKHDGVLFSGSTTLFVFFNLLQWK